MEKIDTVKRDSVCLGEVINPIKLGEWPDGLYCGPRYDERTPERIEQYPTGWFGPHFDGRATNKSLEGKLFIPSYEFSRNMLYVQNEENKSLDLLYLSPNYPILNTSSNLDCLESKILIGDWWNLGLLLQYFGYPEVLTPEQIAKIPEEFFNLEFVKRNCELFGYMEIDENHFRHFYRNPDERKLPAHYFDALYARSNSSAYEVLPGSETHAHVFEPTASIEGPIRKRVK